MAFMKNLQASLKSLGNNLVFNIGGAGAPTDGASGTGVNVCGPGSTYTDATNGNIFMQVGAISSPVWTALGYNQVRGTISAASIIDTGAGGFGHASGYPMLAAQGTHIVVEFVSCVVHFDRATAAYTAGGNITVGNSGGGAALSGLVSAANSLGNAADKSVTFVPLSTVAVPNVENGGLNLMSSAAFTNPGTAAGVIRYVLNYRLYPTGF